LENVSGISFQFVREAFHFSFLQVGRG